MSHAYDRQRRDPRHDPHAREVHELPSPVPVGEAVIEGELVGDTAPAAQEESGADRVVAVAMAVTVTGIAVIGLLNFLSSDPEPEDPDRRKGKRR